MKNRSAIVAALLLKVEDGELYRAQQELAGDDESIHALQIMRRDLRHLARKIQERAS